MTFFHYFPLSVQAAYTTVVYFMYTDLPSRPKVTSHIYIGVQLSAQTIRVLRHSTLPMEPVAKVHDDQEVDAHSSNSAAAHRPFNSRE